MKARATREARQATILLLILARFFSFIPSMLSGSAIGGVKNYLRIVETETPEVTPKEPHGEGNGPIYFGMAVGAVLGLMAYVKGWL